MRVTSLSLKHQVASQIQLSQRRMIEAQERVASGRRIGALSDDPVGLSRSLDYRERIQGLEQYQENAEYGTSLLSLATSALADTEMLLVRARDIAIDAANSSNTETESAALLEELDSITSQITVLMNSKYNDRYIFGGHDIDTPPFAEAFDGQVFWQGDSNPIFLATGPEGMRTQINIDGQSAMAGRSAMISRGDADLDPLISLTTRLDDLHQGAGVSMGSFEIHDREGKSAVVDLVGANVETIGDLVQTINTLDDVDVQASLNADGRGITLTDVTAAPDPELGLMVLEVDEGTTAAELGIWEIAGRTDGIVVGRDLDPRLTEETDVELLNGGEGFDRGEFYIVNGEANAYVDLWGVETVGDILDRIEAAGVGVEAEINEQGTGIEVHALSHGTILHISDLSNGSTASDLGIVGTEGELDVFALLHELRGAVADGDQDASNGLIDGLTEAVDSIIAARAGAGSRLQELELSISRMLGMSMELELAVSGIEDVDFAEAIVELSSTQSIYEAALATTTSVLQLNLVSFL